MMMINETNLNQLKKEKKHRYILALLMVNDLKANDIAKKLGVTTACISRVMHGVGVSRRVQQAIADACGVKYEDLWPRQNRKKTA